MSKNLVDKLLESSQKIHQSSLRGSGNYITVNKNITDIIFKIERPKIRKTKIKNIFDDLV